MEKEQIKESLILKIDFEFLKNIAEYYEFPVAVFLAGKEVFPPKAKTRSDYYRKAALKYERIKDIIEE